MYAIRSYYERIHLLFVETKRPRQVHGYIIEIIAKGADYGPGAVLARQQVIRITSYNVCYTKLLRPGCEHYGWWHRHPG